MVTTIWLDKTRSDGAEHYKAQKHKGCRSQTRKQVHHTVRSWPASPPPATLATLTARTHSMLDALWSNLLNMADDSCLTYGWGVCVRWLVVRIQNCSQG